MLLLAMFLSAALSSSDRHSFTLFSLPHESKSMPISITFRVGSWGSVDSDSINAVESIISNSGDAGWDADRGQSAAAVKRLIPDGCDTVRDRHRGQSATVFKRIIPDGCDAVRNAS